MNEREVYPYLENATQGISERSFFYLVTGTNKLYPKLELGEPKWEIKLNDGDL